MTQLAPGVRRPDRRLLVGAHRVLRLSDAGADALDALLAGQPHPGVDVLRRRLLEAGMLLPPPGPSRLADLTVVVPARGPAGVDRTVAGIPDGVDVRVVHDDDPVPRGPAATRNLGAAQVTTDLVAFVDTGVLLPTGALERLTGFFEDQRVVAVAPRVVSDDAPGLVGVLEQQLCALDLGRDAGEVRPGGVVSYVPSTVLVVRRETFEAVGRFDETLHVGEDVDLVWRLSERGVVRYDPEVVVRHAPRTSLRDALRRRRDYGGSAGGLDAKHPGRLRHLRLTRWSALPWAAALVHPVAGPVAAAAVVLAAPTRLPTLPAADARRLVATGQRASFGAVGRYAVRPAWPLTVAALVSSRRARRVAPLLAAAYVAGSADRLRAGPLRDLPARIGLGLLDDVAYSAGVWSSAGRTGRVRVLLPGKA